MVQVIACGKVLIDRERITIVTRHFVDDVLQEESFIRERTHGIRTRMPVFPRYSFRRRNVSSHPLRKA